jgi:hypothetical protein
LRGDFGIFFFGLGGPVFKQPNHHGHRYEQGRNGRDDQPFVRLVVSLPGVGRRLQGLGAEVARFDIADEVQQAFVDLVVVELYSFVAEGATCFPFSGLVEKSRNANGFVVQQAVLFVFFQKAFDQFQRLAGLQVVNERPCFFCQLLLVHIERLENSRRGWPPIGTNIIILLNIKVICLISYFCPGKCELSAA